MDPLIVKCTRASKMIEKFSVKFFESDEFRGEGLPVEPPRGRAVGNPARPWDLARMTLRFLDGYLARSSHFSISNPLPLFLVGSSLSYFS